MSTLPDLDRLHTELAMQVAMAAPMPNWQQVMYRVRSTPGGSARNSEFDFVLENGRIDRGSSPNRAAELAIDHLVDRQWQMTKDVGKPRWYKMVVTVERSGKFTVDFEYQDDYKEGDILQRG
jgi:hypothetical protein